jgi:hypothetical protein
LVHAKVQQTNPEIRLPDFGIVVSDGFRHIAEPARPDSRWLESNVTRLIELDIADRARAIQVLEYTSNNLEEAVALLLAAGERPNMPVRP